MADVAEFIPIDPEYESRVRASFAEQQAMATIGATLETVGPGSATISVPHHDPITQQDGFVHAGIVATILDSACGYAAFSLMPPEARVLTAEYKINLMAPATGDRIVATGEVVRAGKTLTVCRGTAYAHTEGDATPVAVMQATMMTLRPR